MREQALVTGGAGFIGSHLVDALLARGYRVRVLDNLLEQAHPTGQAQFLSPEAELLVGDLRDRAAVDQALNGVSLVFHQGGMVGNGQSMYDIHRYIDVNSSGTAMLLEAMVARRDQFRRLVMASSMVVYGDGAYSCPQHGPIARATRPIERLRARQWEPLCATCGTEVTAIATNEDHPMRPTSTYGISKRDQEELSLVIGKAYKLPTIALRYLNAYGQRQALSNPYTGVAAIMITRLLNGKQPVVFEDGLQRRDLVHVGDIVSANLAAADADERADYQAFNIGGGRSITIHGLASQLAKQLGKDIEPAITGEYRDGDIRHCFADISRARTFLQWEARTPIETGIADLVSWATHERPEDRTERANAELRAKGLIW